MDSKYKWSIKILNLIATIYLRELLMRKGLASLSGPIREVASPEGTI